jgi:hypothetical protein
MGKDKIPIATVEPGVTGEVSNLSTPTSIITTNEMPSTTPKKATY